MAANFHKSKPDSDDLHRRRCHFSASCKRHPKHRQSPGVCSLCLTERLSQILSATSSSSSRRKVISADSLSSSYCSSSSYSSSASSCSSPNPNFASSMFKKSRSMRILSDFGKKNKKTESNRKLGFWSRFLNWPATMRKTTAMELTHSRSTVVQLHG